jgi:hypothetical protein
MLRTDRCWRGMLSLAGLLLLVPMRGHAIQTTNVQGVVYRADGSVAHGTLLVSWPSFTAVDGSAVAAGNTTATIAPDGSVNMALAPNAGGNPQGTYYTVVYHMTDGTVQKEYWVVPQAATATISQMRARVVPAAVAQQSVTQQYVDTSLSALQGSFLQLKGGTMSGALRLSSDPADAMQAATKAYVDAHAGSQLPAAQNVIAGSGNGGAVSMAEKGVKVTGTNGKVAWDEDLNAGVYDPRDPRFAGGIYGPTPAAAAQAISNQMACDLAMGVVKHAVAKWPQGNFPIDQLQIAPGSDWEGTPTGAGGTLWYSIYNNHQLAHAVGSMTLTCSDGQSHTDNLSGTRVAHFTLSGCATGGCSNAAGDTASYAVGGPGNVGLQYSSNGTTEYIVAQNFGGYGIRNDGQDSKVFHIVLTGNSQWYYYGGYKGVTETALSPEVSATTTGTTGSVALSWPAVSGAAGYIVYRGTSAGGENVWYYVGSNSVTDTGATVSGSFGANNIVTNGLAKPGAITAKPSAAGGTLAAATYYYEVTAYGGDGWHGSIEFAGLDNMADWIEAYGLFDAPNAYTYHHIADILAGGGDSHFDHLWPQLGQVGIAQPYGAGAGDTFENVRIDFARLEGFWNNDTGVRVIGGIIDGSCTSPNAVTLNTGQDGVTFAGVCDQYYNNGTAAAISGVSFFDNNGFGPTYKTADVFMGGAGTYRDLNTANFQKIDSIGIISGATWEPVDKTLHNVTGPVPNVQGLYLINPTDTSPVNYLGFLNVQLGQEFYVKGGNGNVTLNYDPQYLVTCSGQSINLGSVTGFLHFRFTNGGVYGLAAWVAEVCSSTPKPATVSSSEMVTFSATPTFSTAKRASILTLTGNVTGFTLPAGADGQEKTLTFCQNATGGFSITAPSNVHGLFAVGTTANKCSSQHFTYSAAQSAWLADSPGVINE